MEKSAERAAEEPKWIFGKPLPLTPEERETDAERPGRNSHRYTSQGKNCLHMHVLTVHGW